MESTNDPSQDGVLTEQGRQRPVLETLSWMRQSDEPDPKPIQRAHSEVAGNGTVDPDAIEIPSPSRSQVLKQINQQLRKGLETVV